MPGKFRSVLRDARLRVWLFVFPALAILTATLAALILNGHEATGQRREADRRYVQALDVLLATSEIKSAVNAAIRGERGYLLTNDRRFLGPYAESRRDIPRLFGRLRGLTGGNPRQSAGLERLRRRLASYYALLDHTIALAAAGRRDEAQRVVRQGLGKREVENVLREVGRIEAEERRLLALRRAIFARADGRSENYGMALAAAGLAMLILLVLSAIAALRANARADEATAELRRIATTDALTGLWNRRHLLERMEAEIGRSRRGGRPLCVAILDVDHFKRVNDRHGHPAGDEVLRVLAALLRDAVRSSDVIGRMGGEEFAILMPETPGPGPARLRAASREGGAKAGRASVRSRADRDPEHRDRPSGRPGAFRQADLPGRRGALRRQGGGAELREAGRLRAAPRWRCVDRLSDFGRRSGKSVPYARASVRTHARARVCKPDRRAATSSRD
ncbi:MAG TPA: diguanylate cyclase [Allosphingosinicella sp.]|nr:diguanylate cyclase [Allosphingosinicella sp.]